MEAQLVKFVDGNEAQEFWVGLQYSATKWKRKSFWLWNQSQKAG